jgi:protoheme IX farnesyltransferase
MTIAFYVFVYTMWLKRRTPQNIVIGGAAGAFPPMIGWATVSGSITLDSVALFAIIFIWTPPHFWALSLYRSDDYEAAGVPMLPVVAGRRETQKQILIYSLVLAPLALAPTALGTVGLLYGSIAAVLGAGFVFGAWRVCREATDRRCKQLFGYSILYLFLIFLALIIDRAAGMPTTAWFGS